jgi:hypothetical protein
MAFAFTNADRIPLNPKNFMWSTEDKREKIHALSLAKECYSMKLELLTNSTVVDDAIRFVSEYNKSKHESNNYREGAEQGMTNDVF